MPIRALPYLAVFAVLLLAGCQAETPARAPQASLEITLPTEFGESLELGFQVNPELTAKRILRAHDGFARVAPVTSGSVKNYIRLERAADRARILTDIFAVDLNGDQLITPAEFDVLPGLPNGYKKAARLSDLFEYDKNGDSYVSLSEAMTFAENLNASRQETEFAPIGSYLMLFDLNADEEVTRAEILKALRDYVSDSNNPNAELRGKSALR